MNPFKRKKAAAPMTVEERRQALIDGTLVPDYSWCETVTAGPTTPHHIREVGEEGLKFGGGLRMPALCGRDLHGGWDLTSEVTAETVQQFSAPRSGDGRVFACSECAAAYLSLHPLG